MAEPNCPHHTYVVEKQNEYSQRLRNVESKTTIGETILNNMTKQMEIICNSAVQSNAELRRLIDTQEIRMSEMMAERAGDSALIATLKQDISDLTGQFKWLTGIMLMLIGAGVISWLVTITK